MGALNKEANNNDVSMITYFVFAIFVLILIIGFSFVGIAISSGKDLENIISILNNVGGTIGGITSPLLGIVTIIFVYMAYNQQLVANSLLKKEIDEAERLLIEKETISKELILLNLRDNIIPDLNIFSTNLIEFKNKVLSTETKIIIPDIKYTGLNLDIYNSVGVQQIYKIFNIDVLKISTIYRNVEYLNSIVLTDIYSAYNYALNIKNSEVILYEREALIKTISSISMTIGDSIIKSNEILLINSLPNNT